MKKTKAGAPVKKGNVFNRRFERFSNWVTRATGTSTAFLIALLVIIVWGITGPIFNFSEVWQLVINTGTTIVTFLMIFVIQQSQNKETMAMHLKLNELIAASEHSSNRLIECEGLTDEELQIIKKYYHKLTELTKKEESIFISHSLDEAEFDTKRKKPQSNQLNLKK